MDLNTVTDGEYIGVCQNKILIAVVKVCVKNHEIADIEILGHKASYMEQAETIAGKVGVNLKIILKYILTNVKERKARTFVMLLSILLSAMLLFVSFSIGVSYESAQRKMARGMAGSATVSVQSVEGGIHADDIPALPDIQTKAGIVEGTSLYHENGYYETVDLLAADMEALNQINKPRLIGDGEVTAFSGNQIILPDRFTSKYGIEKGDTVTLQINGSPVDFEVAEIAAYDTVFLRHTRGATALLPLETIKEVLGWEDGYSEILIEPAPNSTTDNLISELKNALDNGKYRVSEVVNEAQIAADARQKSMPFFLISFFSLTMSIFIIYSSYKVICHIHLPSYILLFTFLFGYVYTIPTNSLNNSSFYLETLHQFYNAAILDLIFVLYDIAVTSRNNKKQRRFKKMKTSKKYLAFALVSVLMLSALTGCGNKNGGDSGKFDMSREINVLTREDGSGTRGAFIELFGIEQKNEAGEKIDYTADTAAVTNSTSVMMTTVAGDLYSIGYISLGSMNDTVKAIQIDGCEATIENIKNGTYKIARPFNIATKDGLSDTAQDFIDFIMSADGQAVIEENGYISVSDAGSYSGEMDSGKIIVAGSSSVTPVMEKLKEAYLERNPGVTIEIQQSDSSTGMSDTIDGTCDIGMASRELKDSEMEKGLTATVIAMDGITVIVNNDCPINNLTSEQVKDIFMGNAVRWSEISQ